ncbi:MAG: tetratricopeptide repeat protein, partial [Holophagales bacterium]|nr:tetratricopeptide repeat protein [Holophagales bacterium]
MAIKREKVIKAAEKYIAKGKLEAAINEYRKVLRESPNDINTLNKVGDLYARLEKYDEAVRLFSQIADQYSRDGFFVKAIAIYKKIIKLDPTVLQVYERLAELYHRQNLLNEARTQYQILADYYTKHENATSAITIYQRMAEMEPDNPAYRLKLAELFSSQRLVDKALVEYRVLADLLLVNGSVDEAAQVYCTALEAMPENLDFVREAVTTLNEGSHIGAAAKVLARAAELNPEAASLSSLIGSPDLTAAGMASADSASAGMTSAGMPSAEMGASSEAGPGQGGQAPAMPAEAAPERPPPAEDAFAAPEGAYLIADPAAAAEELGSETRFAGPANFEAAGEVGGGASSGSSLYVEPSSDFGGGEEVLTFDLDDDTEPESQVRPPADMVDAPPRQPATPEPELKAVEGEDGEFEFEIELEDGDEGFEALTTAAEEETPVELAEADLIDPDFGEETLFSMDPSEAPAPDADPPAVEAEIPSAPPAGGFEVEWGMRDMDALDLPVPAEEGPSPSSMAAEPVADSEAAPPAPPTHLAPPEGVAGEPAPFELAFDLDEEEPAPPPEAAVPAPVSPPSPPPAPTA